MDLDGPPIVIDAGTRLTKVGLASDSLPKHVFPTMVARPKNFQRSSEMRSDFIKFGQDAEDVVMGDIRDYSPKYPIEWGIPMNWDLCEDLLEHILYDVMKGRHEDTPILLTEVTMIPRLNREKFTQFMFETHDVGHMFMCNTATLTAYSSGTLDGVVVELGHDAAQVVPVYDGACLRYAAPKCIFNASDIYWHLEALLHDKMTQDHPKSEWSFSDRHHRHVIRDIVKKHCYFALDYQKELQKAEEGLIDTQYTLPDGTVLQLSKELIESTEVLFDPSIQATEMPNLPWHVVHSLNRVTSPEMKETISGPVIVGGAITTLPGFTERLENEINREYFCSNKNQDQSSSTVHEFQVRDLANKEYSAWIGGSVFASRSEFTAMCMTKEEYDEYGPVLVHKKCFL